VNFVNRHNIQISSMMVVQSGGFTSLKIIIWKSHNIVHNSWYNLKSIEYGFLIKSMIYTIYENLIESNTCIFFLKKIIKSRYRDIILKYLRSIYEMNISQDMVFIPTDLILMFQQMISDSRASTHLKFNFKLLKEKSQTYTVVWYNTIEFMCISKGEIFEGVTQKWII
jgi:hypothetical protein